MCLLKAYPLVEKTNKDSISRAGSICRYSSNFRHDMHSRLKLTGKEVCVRMDILSREKLMQCLEEKCMILQLSSELTTSSQLYFEKENGIADSLSLLDFSELVGGNLHQYGVELLILAMPFSVKIGEYCSESLKVPHVVCFNMLDYPKDGEPIQIYLIFEKAIHQFCLELYTNIINGLTIRESCFNAKTSMEDFITKESQEIGYLEHRGLHFIT